MTAQDLLVMTRWGNAPHVARWWDSAGTLADTSATYLPMIEGIDPTVALIVEWQGEPIGHGQWCQWGWFPDDASRFDAPPQDYCVDYFIGRRELCGHGIGTLLVAALLADVRATVPVQRWPECGFLVDVDSANTASCRVLEKNGFVGGPDPHPERSAPGEIVTVFRRPLAPWSASYRSTDGRIRRRA